MCFASAFVVVVVVNILFQTKKNALIWLWPRGQLSSSSLCLFCFFLNSFFSPFFSLKPLAISKANLSLFQGQFLATKCHRIFEKIRVCESRDFGKPSHDVWLAVILSRTIVAQIWSALHPLNSDVSKILTQTHRFMKNVSGRPQWRRLASKSGARR